MVSAHTTVPASLRASQPTSYSAPRQPSTSKAHVAVQVCQSLLLSFVFFSQWSMVQPLTSGAGITKILQEQSPDSCLCALFSNTCLCYFLAAACKHCRYTFGFHYLICCKGVTRLAIQASYHITSGTAISAQVTLGKEEYISKQWRRTRADPWIKTAGVWGGQPEAGSG